MTIKSQEVFHVCFPKVIWNCLALDMSCLLITLPCTSQYCSGLKQQFNKYPTAYQLNTKGKYGIMLCSISIFQKRKKKKKAQKENHLLNSLSLDTGWALSVFGNHTAGAVQTSCKLETSRTVQYGNCQGQQTMHSKQRSCSSLSLD